MKIHARTPNRIDLAGGTLDIYPLYLFLDGGYTLNAAIDLYSEISLETLEADHFVFRSQDLDEDLTLSRDELLQGAGDDSPFRLLVAALRFYRPAGGLRITSANQAPKGSGLGASSALLMALSGALNHLNRHYWEGERLIRHAADLEAWALEIPTGKQDYYAALYGGLQAIHFSSRGIQREPLQLSQAFFEALNAGLVLSFTGQSHFSGTNNWNMMKRRLPADPLPTATAQCS
jgi:D-glycero-alpha-D-manno-heptose-7-phosphate kinase